MADSLEFRCATLADVDDIVMLVESAYRGESSKAGWTTEADLLDGQRTDRDTVKAIIGSPNASVVLAFGPAVRDLRPDRTPALLACCQLERRDETTAYFGMFAVRPGLQGGGVGKRVLGEAERQARDEWHATSMEMTVIAQRAELVAWYLRRGYRRTGETRPFPYGDARFGEPRRPDLEFVVLAKALG